MALVWRAPDLVSLAIATAARSEIARRRGYEPDPNTTSWP